MLKDNRRKLALTLGELCIVFIIMGVVAGMTMNIVKPRDNAIKYVYSRIYNSLGTAYYNALTDIPKTVKQADMDNGFPKSSENFCKMLLAFINDKSGEGNKSCPGGNCPVANCSADTIMINPGTEGQDYSGTLDGILNSTEPHFVASNGSKVWIGHTKTSNKNTYVTLKYCPNNLNTTGVCWNPYETRGYIVIVDLNGEMTPNTTKWSPDKISDIVAFFVTEDYFVMPLGVPQVDSRYLLAQVVYSTTAGVDSEDLETSTLMPYYRALRLAWAKENGTPVGNIRDIYTSNTEIASLNPSIDENKNIIFGSPFYLDLNGNKGSDEIKESVADLNNVTFDREHCGKAENKTTLDPDACYVKILDYH